MTKTRFSQLLQRILSVCIAYSIGLSTSIVFAQASALTPNHDAENQFKPIPRRMAEPGKSNLRSGGEKVHIDRMVYKASFDEQPQRDTQTQLPWTYRLRNLDHQQFKSRLTEIWGENLLASSLDENGRMIRVFFPDGNFAPESSMKFDQMNGELTYEGSPRSKMGWHKLMQLLDQRHVPQARFAAKAVDIGSINHHDVRLVSAQFAVQDQDQDPGPDSVDIRSDQLSQIADQITGNVEINIVPGTNVLTITGDPESVANIKRFLESLNKRSAEMGAMVKLFPLKFTDPQSVVDQISALYEDKFEPIHDQVRLIAAPTGILAAGSEGGLKAIESIVKGLEGIAPADVIPDDKPLTEYEKGYRKFVLRHIEVFQAQRAVLTLFGQAINNNTADQNRQAQAIDTFIDPITNTLVIYARPEQLKRAEALIEDIDIKSEEGQTARIWRIFQIRNHRAPDFAILLQDTLTQGLQANIPQHETTNTQIQGGGQNTIRQQQFGQRTDIAPFTQMAPLRVQLNGQPSEPINFFDVRITSDPASNSIQVSAAAEAMAVIEGIIEALDKLPDLTSEVKIFPIINGDAQQILDSLEQIFGASTQTGGGQNQTGSLADLPLQSPGSDGASLINIRFAINQRTNTIIASGSAGDLEFVEALIFRLDEKDVQDRQTAIYRLSNASVLEVSAAINTMLTEREAIFSTNPITNSETGVARRDVIVVEEQTSNSLIVNARPEYFAEIDYIINALDRRPPMVKVKAMIVQVDLNQLENFGVEFGLQDSDIFAANATNAVGAGFVGLDNPAGQLLSNLGVGRAGASGLSGLLLTAGDDSLNFVLRFLKQKGCASVLFSPQVATMENLEGRFRQGATIQRATGSNTTGLGNVIQQFVETPIGIQLAITPRVSPDGLIVMFVDVENSTLGLAADGTVIGVDGMGNQIISQPINQTLAQTTVMARSGQTVILSGLIQEQKGQTINSIPFLGDLPVIGPVFQNVENTAERQEILIFLTPYVVDGEDDLSVMNEDDINRMHWCRADVAEVYGNTSYTGTPYREHYPKIYYPDVDPRGQNPEFEGIDPQDSDAAWQDDQGTQPGIQDDGWRDRNESLELPGPGKVPQGSSSRNDFYQDQRHDRYDMNNSLPTGRVGQQESFSNRSMNLGMAQDAQRHSPSNYENTDDRSRSHRFADNRSYPQDRPRTRHTARSDQPFQPLNSEANYPIPPATDRKLQLDSRSTGARFKLH